MLTLRRPAPSSPEPHGADGGFSLIEVIVAMVILGLVATVIGALLVNSLDVTKDNTARTTAADLAASAIEKARAQRALDIPDGRVVTSVLVGNTTYQVAQDAAYVNLDSASACSAGGSLAYKRVTVTVTWPNMGSTQPVRSDTLRSLGFGGDNLTGTNGAASVQLKGATAQPISDIPVTLRTDPGGVVAGTLTTGDDGCVVFPNLNPGSYRATVSSGGYVSVHGFPTLVSDLVPVTAGNVATTEMLYDQHAPLTLNLVPPAGYAVPAQLGVTLQTGRWPAPLARVFLDCAQPSAVANAPHGCVSGPLATTRTAARLFPASYTGWAGTCNDATPPVLPTLVTVGAGAAPVLDAPLAGVNISTGYVTTGVPATGTVYATHIGDGGRCPSGASINLGPLPPIGVVSRVALPYGTWNIQRVNSTTTTTFGQTVVLSSITGPQSVTVR